MGDSQDHGSSFEKRLNAARARHKLDEAAAEGSADRPASAIGVGLRVGVELVSALVVAVAIGWFLDHWLHTMPLFLVIFVLLGGAAGLVNVLRLIGPGGRRL